MIHWNQLTVRERTILLELRKLPTELASWRWDQFPRALKLKLQHNYTHRDQDGMLWRFEGSRRVSALGDQMMKDCGLELLDKLDQHHAKAK